MKMAECFWLLSDEMLKPFPEVASKYPPIIVARPNLMKPVLEDSDLVGWIYRRGLGNSFTCCRNR